MSTMIASRSIRVVCFDWGGVILRICRSWSEACAKAGLDVRGDSASSEHAAHRRAAAHAFQTGAIDEATFTRRLSEALGGLYTPEEVGRIHDAWLIEEYAGVAEVIAHLNRVERVQTALLSNTNERHWRRRAPRAGCTLPTFPTITTLRHPHASHILRCAKPEESIYVAFEHAVGAKPHEILFFDDLEENIRTAGARGWHVCQIDHTGDTALQISRQLASHGLLEDERVMAGAKP
ncbi:MAG: HAD-IA family hydrolase [Planctomycetota bacterium]|nr:HAD-IA family hydrolase [Planctomycetota bacterium]